MARLYRALQPSQAQQDTRSTVQGQHVEHAHAGFAGLNRVHYSFAKKSLGCTAPLGNCSAQQGKETDLGRVHDHCSADLAIHIGAEVDGCHLVHGSSDISRYVDDLHVATSPSTLACMQIQEKDYDVVQIVVIQNKTNDDPKMC